MKIIVTRNQTHGYTLEVSEDITNANSKTREKKRDELRTIDDVIESHFAEFSGCQMTTLFTCQINDRTAASNGGYIKKMYSAYFFPFKGNYETLFKSYVQRLCSQLNLPFAM